MNTTFIYGFLAGILFVILLCYWFAVLRPDYVARKNSKFFLDLNARKRRRTIEKTHKFKRVQ